MPVKLTQGLTLFIIFTSTKNTSSMSIPFILREIISSWISLIQSLGSPSSEAQIFSKITIRCSLVVPFSQGLTIFSEGYYSPCSRPLKVFHFIIIPCNLRIFVFFITYHFFIWSTIRQREFHSLGINTINPNSHLWSLFKIFNLTELLLIGLHMSPVHIATCMSSRNNQWSLNKFPSSIPMVVTITHLIHNQCKKHVHP